MTFETADDVLEHFGVKGMRWGVRKERSSGSGSSGGKEKTSKKKRAIQVAAVAGAIAAGVIIAHHSGVRVSSLRGSSSLPSGLAPGNRSSIAKSALRSQNIMSKLIAKEGRTRASSIPHVPAMPRRRITRSAAGDIAKMRAEIADSIRAANSELRANDNRLNIPIHARSYLTEWD